MFFAAIISAACSAYAAQQQAQGDAQLREHYLSLTRLPAPPCAYCGRPHRERTCPGCGAPNPSPR